MAIIAATAVAATTTALVATAAVTVAAVTVASAVINPLFYSQVNISVSMKIEVKVESKD